MAAEFGIDPDAAPFSAAHGAVVPGIVLGDAAMGAGFVVHSMCGFGVQGLAEMLFPVEICAGFAEASVALGGVVKAAGDVGGVCGFLEAMTPWRTSSRLGRPRCSRGVT